MFYFLLAPLMTYRFLLIAAAVIPAAFLMVKVYQSDRLDRESPQMLWSLVKAGVFASLIALVLERVLSRLLGLFARENTVLYQVILYFGIVAFSEEGAKYALMKKNSWNSPEFNCLFDGVVYAVFASLGFAVWENISYVLNFGFQTALVRAVTAIPGHACFGVFMGIFYAQARKSERAGDHSASRLHQALAVLVPALLHGAYDYIATWETGHHSWFFIGFIAVLFFFSLRLVNGAARNDRYI